MTEIKHRFTGTVLKTVDANTLRGADLSYANLGNADLRNADLSYANLSGANLSCANLSCANLRNADLRNADLSYAVLRGADLSYADLSYAVLRGANLRNADLRNADLRSADLRSADLSGAVLSSFQLCPDGKLVVYKKASGYIVQLELGPKVKRTSSLVGRKCRAESAKVKTIFNLDRTKAEVTEVTGSYDGKTVYKIGETVIPDKYDDDIRVECTHGIHFFITFEEARDY